MEYFIVSKTSYTDHTNKQPDKNIIPAGTLMWYWDPLSKEQEQVMLLEDLQEEKYMYLAKVSVLYQTMKKTVWCSNLCIKRFDKKPGINPCQEIPLETISMSTTYSENTVIIESTVRVNDYPSSFSHYLTKRP
jgi:hypothetical protein